MNTTQKLADALRAAEAKLCGSAVAIDSEWGDCRDIAQIEKDGELWGEIIAARAALAEYDAAQVPRPAKLPGNLSPMIHSGTLPEDSQ